MSRYSQYVVACGMRPDSCFVCQYHPGGIAERGCYSLRRSSLVRFLGIGFLF